MDRSNTKVIEITVPIDFDVSNSLRHVPVSIVARILELGINFYSTFKTQHEPNNTQHEAELLRKIDNQEKEISQLNYVLSQINNPREQKIDDIHLFMTQMSKFFNGSNMEKGDTGELFVKQCILKSFANAEIKDVSGEAASGDLIVEIDGIFIMLEVKNKKVITNLDIDKFKRDISEKRGSISGAIFVSLQAPISRYSRPVDFEDITGVKVAKVSKPAANDIVNTVSMMLYLCKNKNLIVGDKMTSDIMMQTLKEDAVTYKELCEAIERDAKTVKMHKDHKARIEQRKAALEYYLSLIEQKNDKPIKQEPTQPVELEDDLVKTPRLKKHISIRTTPKKHMRSMKPATSSKLTKPIALDTESQDDIESDIENILILNSKPKKPATKNRTPTLLISNRVKKDKQPAVKVSDPDDTDYYTCNADSDADTVVTVLDIDLFNREEIIQYVNEFIDMLSSSSTFSMASFERGKAGQIPNSQRMKYLEERKRRLDLLYKSIGLKPDKKVPISKRLLAIYLGLKSDFDVGLTPLQFKNKHLAIYETISTYGLKLSKRLDFKDILQDMNEIVKNNILPL